MLRRGVETTVICKVKRTAEVDEGGGVNTPSVGRSVAPGVTVAEAKKIRDECGAGDIVKNPTDGVLTPPPSSTSAVSRMQLMEYRSLAMHSAQTP